MQLKLFGEFSLIAPSGERIAVPLRRGQALISYLASKESRRESREVLLDLLWPDRFKEQAQSSLRQVIYELQRLGPKDQPLIEATRDDVSLGPAILACDLWRFESKPGDFNGSMAEELLDLYAGPFLSGPPLATEPFQQWTAIQRARLENQLEAAILETAHSASRPAETALAIKLLIQLLERCPMSFQAIAKVMELSAASGQPAVATRQFEHFAKRLKLECGEVPPQELFDFYKALKAVPEQTPTGFARLRQPAFAHKNPWAHTSSDAPVIAVLPFQYQGLRPERMELANALSEDIIMMLSGCRWFGVLSRSSTHSIVQDAQFIPRDFARKTGANHLVYGTIADRGDKLSLTIELANAETGFITWAKRYDAAGEDLLKWASEVCPMIVAALDPAVVESEHLALSKPAIAATDCLWAYQYLVKGYRHYYAGEWDKAIASFQDAVDEDKTYAHGYAMLANTRYSAAQAGRDNNFDAMLELAEQSARRALEIDPSEAKANIALGQILDWRGKHNQSAAFLDRAISLNPSFSQASTARSYHAVMTGSFEAAKTYVETSMRLRVGDAGLGFCLPSKAMADLHMGNPKEALQTAHWAQRLAPDFWLSRMTLATSLFANDEMDSARLVVSELKRDYQGLTAEEFASWFPYANAQNNTMITKALVKSGWD